MNEKVKSVRISSSSYELLKKRKEQTGCSITFMIDRAVEEAAKAKKI